MNVIDKVRTDLDLHKWSNLGMGVYAIEISYPKVGVGLIRKQYLKLCANADTDADRRRRKRLGYNVSSPGT